MKSATCGSLESNDCLITVSESDILDIKINSIVYDLFGDAIFKVVLETLNQLGINNLKVTVNDKGALDYAIRARLITAIKRLEK
ncbi:MAG: citrate lyase acyl carrier protein [Bacilli bacterium]|jgi:citrate lyase subunit gamma (acyl carrier protein)|nr:citrate lyase acyl carrier protein [Bacilli bacterium]MDD2682390.1 citrate lyase acyl carrier protein [Bacilli bacterium]MDD3121797.1 citrate lyase acyl carrier protein [Bacilli bacterium]MDD4063307.1 citrate lyase acyl carrier protein [Bacilli bacterium]MDD4482189.1 citrate lyase acyl carrier protein [Bacilli bacterium]